MLLYPIFCKGWWSFTLFDLGYTSGKTKDEKHYFYTIMLFGFGVTIGIGDDE